MSSLEKQKMNDQYSIRDSICRTLTNGKVEPDLRMLPLVRQVVPCCDKTLYPKYDKTHSSYSKAVKNYLVRPCDALIQPPNWWKSGNTS